MCWEKRLYLSLEARKQAKADKVDQSSTDDRRQAKRNAKCLPLKRTLRLFFSCWVLVVRFQSDQVCVCVCILSVVSRTTVSGVPVCSTNRMLRQSCVRTADCFAGHCQGSGAPYLRRDTVRANFRLNFGFISAVTTRGVRRRGLINTTTTMYNRRSITWIKQSTPTLCDPYRWTQLHKFAVSSSLYYWPSTNSAARISAMQLYILVAGPSLRFSRLVRSSCFSINSDSPSILW